MVGYLLWYDASSSTARQGENSLWLFEDAVLGRSGRALARARSKIITYPAAPPENVLNARS